MPNQRYYVSVPDITVAVDCDEDGTVKETYTAWRNLRGCHISTLISQLKQQWGAEQVYWEKVS